MDLREQLKKARELMQIGHADQTRFNGTPYVAHPLRISIKFEQKGDLEAAIVAALHDIIEDTDFDEYTLINNGIDAKIIGSVLAITKNYGEDYSFYLERVKENPLAKKVKIADILDNLGDTPTKNQVKRYAAALEFLLD